MADMTVRSYLSADERLAPDNYPALNKAFYASKPADYFGQRLENLILTAGRHVDLDRLMDNGATYHDLRVGAHADGGAAKSRKTSPDDRAKSVEHFVIAESEVLAQHVGETLLRLYLAHAFVTGRASPCPWLEISRLRSPAKFKEKVRARFGPDSDPKNPDNLNAVARVFHLTDDPTKLTGGTVPRKLWKRSLENIEGYLRGFARQFLDRSALYNAAKHGLALLPGEASMRLGDGDVIQAEGPMIQYLEIQENDGRPRWMHVNHWVQPDRQIAVIFRACQLIEALWEVARIRYLPAPPERFDVKMFGGASWHDMIASGPERTGAFVLETMSVGLLYYVTAEERAAEDTVGR